MELNLMRLIAEKQESNEEVALITVISPSANNCSAGAMMVVDKNGEILGGRLGSGLLQENTRLEAKTCIQRGLSRKAIIRDDTNEVEIFVTSFCHTDRLIIAGAGSVALHVYEIANLLGYNISIIDNRTEMLVSERFPEASELIIGDIALQLSKYDITEETSIVIATHHHEFDEPALQAVISSPARYIGVLGNKRKVASYYSNLHSLGFSEALINRVHMPIGHDLGGQKTAEIALAIIADVQAVKYERPGGFAKRNKEGD